MPLDLSLLPYEILPAAFTISFRSLPLPSCCWIGVPEVLPFSLPDFWAACGKSSSGCRSVHDGTLLKSLLESGFAWSSYLLISGCFLSVTILYHSPWDSSIRRYANDAAKDLCSFKLAAPGKKWYNKYVVLLYSPDCALPLLERDGAFLAGLCCDPTG